MIEIPRSSLERGLLVASQPISSLRMCVLRVDLSRAVRMLLAFVVEILLVSDHLVDL